MKLSIIKNFYLSVQQNIAQMGKVEMSSNPVADMAISICEEYSKTDTCPERTKAAIDHIMGLKNTGMASIQAICEFPSKDMDVFQELFFAFDSENPYCLLLTCWNASVTDNMEFVSNTVDKIFPMISSDTIHDEATISIPWLWSILEIQYGGSVDLSKQ
jgi:hypothetical protein